MKEREKTAFPQKCQKMEEKVTHCMRMRMEDGKARSMS